MVILEILKVIFFLLVDVILFFSVVGMLATKVDGGKEYENDDIQRPDDK